MNAVKQWNNVMCFGCFCDLYHKNSTVWNHILRLHCRRIYAISLMIGPAMRSGRCTWRPSCRTTEKLWRLRTLPRRSSPPLPVIRWVEQVRKKSHTDHVFLLHFASVLVTASLHLNIFLFLHRAIPYSATISLLPLHLLLPFTSISPLIAYICWWISNEDGPAVSAVWPTSNTLLSPLPQSLPHAVVFVCSCFKLLLSVQLLSPWI